MNKRFLRKQMMHQLLSESSDHISNTFHIFNRNVIETTVPKKRTELCVKVHNMTVKTPFITHITHTTRVALTY